MARAPKRNGKRSEAAAEDARPVRDRIIDATMALLAQRSLGEIGFGVEDPTGHARRSSQSSAAATLSTRSPGGGDGR